MWHQLPIHQSQWMGFAYGCTSGKVGWCVSARCSGQEYVTGRTRSEASLHCQREGLFIRNSIM